MRYLKHSPLFFALMAGTAVLVVQGPDGFVETALAALTCEYVACVGLALSGADVLPGSTNLLHGRGLYVLLAAAALLDGFLGSVLLFRAAVCVASAISSLFPKHWINPLARIYCLEHGLRQSRRAV
jgi:hypothetical protein